MDRKYVRQLNWFYISAIVCLLTYFFLRFIYSNSIEFGYDQPKLATAVNEFLVNGSFIDAHQFVLTNPWGTYSWGPANIFFFAPFLAITKNPIHASLLVSVFGAISVLTIIFLVQKFFSKRVALIAGFLLAIHPWWVIFSRMIYEPTPVIPIVSLSMLLFFVTIENKKSFSIFFLVFSWAFLFEIYHETFGFILMSFLLLLPKLRNISYRYLSVGIIFSLILFLPSFYFYRNNPSEFLTYIKAANKLSEGRSFFGEASEVGKWYMKIISGLGFEWQLGSAWKEFSGNNLGIIILGNLTITILTILFLFGTAKIFINKSYKRLVLFLWAITPLWFLTLVRVPDVVPRYFLFAIPSICIFTAISFCELLNFVKTKITWLLLLVVVGFYLIFLPSYFNFIVSYSYPNGFISYTSDPPYSFLKSALDWVMQDAQSRNYKNFVVSNDSKNDKTFNLEHSSYYLLKYVYKKDLSYKDIDGYYLIIFSNQKQSYLKEDYQQFGPYVVFNNSPNQTY